LLMLLILLQFSGLEVQPGKTVKVNPGENKYLHLSQVLLTSLCTCIANLNLMRTFNWLRMPMDMLDGEDDSDEEDEDDSSDEEATPNKVNFYDELFCSLHL
ncbi:hypothetical protein GW17_00011001, partial [Ensete ventricosum]